MSDSRGAFFDQFLEDYFAETEEHLANTRRVLLDLEGRTGTGLADPNSLRDLLRSLHTMKGLSGMVGDAGAERVTHALEESLRGVEHTSALAPQFLDALYAGVEALEQCAAALRAGGAAPDVEPVIARLSESSGQSGAVTSLVAADAGASTSTAVVGPSRGMVHLFVFTPSIALSERGISVDFIRGRLRALGELLTATPRMIDQGVVFDFLVAVSPGNAPADSWKEEGLEWHQVPEHPWRSAVADDTAPRSAAAEQDQAPGAVPGAGASVARVELTRLDAVMRLMGDLVVSRSRLDELLRQTATGELESVRDALDETNSTMERQLRRLREGIMRIRLVPIGEVFERLRFTARDAIRESGKQIGLVFHGQGTELDKVVVDRLLEPLLHLVRNAVTHGIEQPDERVAQGKPAQGTLTLRATPSGDRIILEVSDDGAGIDVEQVALRGRAAGILEADEVPTHERLLEVLCAPGLSTRDASDMTSGRGVGMDVVRSAIRALAGELSLWTEPGVGTRFRIELPMTLMIVDALLVEVAGQQMAVPQPTLREIVQVDTAVIVTFENNEVVSYRGGVLPVIALSGLFGLASERAATMYLLVVGAEEAPVGLMVDRLVGLREIVVHPIGDPLVDVPGVSGATELGDGRVSLILDPAALLRMAQERKERGTILPAMVESRVNPVRRRAPTPRS